VKALVTTFPFSQTDPKPMEILRAAGIQVVVNPLGRKMTTAEVAHYAHDVDIIVAGTEVLDHQVMDRALSLKLISRVGVGLDGLDLNDLRSRSIRVAYTPEAPAPAVAELTIGLMLAGLRRIPQADATMRQGQWQRFFGERLAESHVAVIGAGRIGGRVIQLLQSFNPQSVLVFDTDSARLKTLPSWAKAASWEEIYAQADVISFHTPLNSRTRGMVGSAEIARMKRKPLLVNTARGGILDEADLLRALEEGRVRGAAIDVFEQEPYTGPLAQIPQCILTSHMGSMSVDCRVRMEIEACEEAARFARGDSLLNEVPEDEYNNQSGKQ
jgi:D-3-phosphoglycerate dehydrogenase / 2-oxoglutarate reductase